MPKNAMSKGFDYSKWDAIELSDDEEDCHPNIEKVRVEYRRSARFVRLHPLPFYLQTNKVPLPPRVI